MAFMAKMQGIPQKTATLICEEGIVRRKDSNMSPPSPNPTPAMMCPSSPFADSPYFLSLSPLLKRGFLLS